MTLSLLFCLPFFIVPVCLYDPCDHDEPEEAGKNDQVRNEMESDVNVKADLELTQLHEKIDELTAEDIAELKTHMAQMYALLEKLPAQKGQVS